MTTESVIKKTRKRMDNSIKAFRRDMSKVRTGHTSPDMLSSIKASYYGSMTPIDQMARVTLGEGRILMVEPWDSSAIEALVKAIQTSDMGLNPQVQGNIIRVTVPALNQERRQSIVRSIGARSEEARVSIRNTRRDTLEEIRSLEKTGECSQDDSRRAQGTLQKITDSATNQINEYASAKESEVMQL